MSKSYAFSGLLKNQSQPVNRPGNNTPSSQTSCSDNKLEFTVSDYLLTRLQQLGLDKVFQVPGDYLSDFMRVLDKFDGIDAVSEISEPGAGYAADGYARYRGIGAVSVQFGVGSFSVLNAVSGAYVERNPVVVIAASPSTQSRKAIQQTGVLFHHSTGRLSTDLDVFKNVTVAAEVIDSHAQASQQIDHLLTQAITHSRPVYLEAWQDIWGKPCCRPLGKLRPLLRRSQSEPQNALINETMSKLASARLPVVMLGVEITRFTLQEEALELLQVSGLLYATTLLGKTTISETKGKFIGTYFGAASNPQTREIIEGADAMLALGAVFTDDYIEMLEQQYEQMICVDAETARAGFEHYKNIALKDFIEALTVAMKESDAFPRYGLKRPIVPYLHQNTPELLAQPLGYKAFFNVLYAHLFEQDLIDKTNLVLGDSSAMYQAARLIGLEQNSFVGDAAWSSLGHETGCVMGTAMACNKRSMVIAGDGGFMMMGQSLSNLKRHALDAVVFVMSNKVYAVEQAFTDVQAFHGKTDFSQHNELPEWNFQSLAEAYGVTGFKVSTCEQLLNVLRLLQMEPTQAVLVEVEIDKQELAPALGDVVNALQVKPMTDYSWPDINRIVAERVN